MEETEVALSPKAFIPVISDKSHGGSQRYFASLDDL